MTLIDNVQDTSLPCSSRHFTNVRLVESEEKTAYHACTPNVYLCTFLSSLRNDPSLYTDDVGIKYSKCLNSCRIPRVSTRLVSV
jgi:hypothetical protein